MNTTPSMLQTVAKTKAPVRFLCFVGFLIALSMAGAAVWLIMTAFKAESTMDMAVRFTVGGTLIINAVLALQPTFKLWSFADSCGQFALTKSASALEVGLRHHRRFWSSWGVLTIAALALNLMMGLILYFVAIG